ncbi:hypothetical protein DPMN_087066 [Dreissena polymorpha]|uniref:Uncharacterized protein n=1 Tax=Dreissena polymorpha TaxID=45954 RepID=A0A9D4KSJ9_DREPO|nr:hypothetical protein DPMN_087066 [Dreissena polymorpha]
MSSECITVDEARKFLFTQKGRASDNKPPSSSALHQHIKREAYQARFCWGQSLNKQQEPNPPSS